MNIRNKIFAKNLRRERKIKGFTQEQIAAKLNIGQKRYASWEEGRGAPDFLYLSKLCELFQIDDLYLFISKDLVESG